MIDRQHDLPITKQATALGISRGCVYYLPRSVSSADLGIMRRIDERHLDFPFAGSRMLRDLLNAEGIQIGRQHVATLIRRMGIAAIDRRPNTTREKLTEPVADNTIATAYYIYFDYFLPCIPVNGRILKLGGVSSPEKSVPSSRITLRDSSPSAIAIETAFEITPAFLVSYVKNLFIRITRRPTKHYYKTP
jgi:hypothetical protein